MGCNVVNELIMIFFGYSNLIIELIIYAEVIWLQMLPFSFPSLYVSRSHSLNLTGSWQFFHSSN